MANPGVSYDPVTAVLTVEDESTGLPLRYRIAFVGAGVTVTDDGERTVVTVPGGGSGTISDGSITIDKLAFNVGTQAELDAVSTALAASNVDVARRILSGKRYTRGRTWGDSVAKGAGAYRATGRTMQLVGGVEENQAIGGVAVTDSGSPYSWIRPFQRVTPDPKTAPPYQIAGGAPGVEFPHWGPNDSGVLGRAPAPMSAVVGSLRAVTDHLRSVCALDCEGFPTGGTRNPSTTTANIFDRNSNVSLRKLTNGQSIPIGGTAPFDSSWPGGDACFIFSVETGDDAVATITDGGTTVATVTLKGKDACNPNQRLLRGGTAGTFTLTYRAQTTSAIAWNATDATIRTALEALSTVGTGNVTVVTDTGQTPNVTSLGFKGTAVPAATDALATVSNTSLTGTNSVLPQYASVSKRVSLPAGARNLTVTAAVTSGSVQVDRVACVPTGAIPKTICLRTGWYMTSGGNSSFFGGQNTDAQIDTLSDAIVALAAEWTDGRVVAADIRTLHRDAAANRSADGVHFTETGHAEIAKVILAALPVLSASDQASLSNPPAYEWLDLTLLSPWVAATSVFFDTTIPSPQYRIDANRMVHLRGVITRPSAWTGGDAIAALPRGFRPGRSLYPSATVPTNNTSTTMQLMIVFPAQSAQPAASVVGRLAVGSNGGSGSALHIDLGSIAPFLADGEI